MQGTYVITAQGKLLGRLNSSNPKRVVAMLEKALATWQAMSEGDRRADPATQPEPVHRWEDSFPEGGLVLERFARDIGPGPTGTAQQPANRDAVWFHRDELAGWLPDPEVGAEADVAPGLLERLARFVLVDNVRGQTLPFARAELQGCALRSKVVAVRGQQVDLELTGHTKAAAKGPWLDDENYWKPKREFPRQIECRLLGRATFDREAQRFVSFELVATGVRQGRTAFNRRSKEDPSASHRIGFVMRLAKASFRVAPTFINMYGTRWVTRPAARGR